MGLSSWDLAMIIAGAARPQHRRGHGTNLPLRCAAGRETLRRMTKRIAAALLWFIAGWYAWNVFAWMAGMPELGGPVVGAALAALFAGDPFGRIWTTTRTRPVAPAATAAPEPA